MKAGCGLLLWLYPAGLIGGLDGVGLLPGVMLGGILVAVLVILPGSYPADLGGGMATGDLNSPELGLYGIFAFSDDREAVLDMLEALLLWASGTAGVADMLSGCVIAAVFDLVFLAYKGSGLLAGAALPAKGAEKWVPC